MLNKSINIILWIFLILWIFFSTLMANLRVAEVEKKIDKITTSQPIEK